MTRTADRGIAPARLTPALATTSVLPPWPTGPRLGWRAAAGLFLAAGALAIALLTAWRFTRFGRLLGCAQPAPDAIAERAARLATRLGLSRVPPVLLVPARIPPMLWPHRGGPRLLLPASLLPGLADDELDALLAHELAHVRRRDHWVRLVEITATALFWWYPVTWWARRALRRAEERCCDEWVLRLLPQSAEAYANGLLKSLTFIAARPGPLPAVASGAGPVEDLEARLKEILMTRPMPRLAVPLRLTLAAAAAFSLAVFPTRADSPATTTRTAATAETASTSETPAPPAVPAPRPAAKPALAPHARLAPLAALTPLPAIAPVAAVDATPQAQPAPAPEPAIASGTRTSDPARRAIEEQRRAIEDQRRQLQRQEFELQRKQIDLEAQAEQAELRAEAARLQAEGKTEDAARIERQVHLNTERVELQKRQLGLELERAALEAKLEAEVRAHEDELVGIEEGTREGAEGDARLALKHAEHARQQAEQELEKKQQAIEAEVMEAEKQMQSLAAEDQVRAMRDSTDDLVRSLAEQIQSLKEVAAEAPAQKAAVEHEIQRLTAALDALESGSAPKSLPRKTPRPQP